MLGALWRGARIKRDDGETGMISAENKDSYFDSSKFTPFLWGTNGSRCEGGREGDLPWREINR